MTLRLSAKFDADASALVKEAGRSVDALGKVDAAAKGAGAGAGGFADSAGRAGAGAAAFAAGAQGAAISARQMQVEANNTALGMELAARQASAFGAVLTTLGVGAFLKAVSDTSAEFQRLNGMLETATGSAGRAAAAFDALKRFAAATPYDLGQVTEAFVQLKNLGLDASIDSLTAYGNFASAMGKPLMQFSEAVADAVTGEFERLKEFGIRAEQQGAKVRLTFRGVTAEIGNNATEIERYLQRLGKVEFVGSMDKQAATLGGALSNLSDNWDQFLVTVGQGGVAAEIQRLAQALAAGAAGGDALALALGKGLGAGLHGIGEAAAWTADNLDLVAGAAAGIGAAAVVARIAALAGAIQAAGGAAAVLNATLLANPIAVAALGIGAVAGAVATYSAASAHAAAETAKHNQLITELDDVARGAAHGMGALTDAERGHVEALVKSGEAALAAAQAEVDAIAKRLAARKELASARLIGDPIDMIYRSMMGQSAPGTQGAGIELDEARLSSATTRLDELRAGLSAARAALTGAATAGATTTDTAKALERSFRAAADAAGLVATGHGLVTKSTAELEGHTATLNRVLALTPDEMAKLGVSAADVSRILGELTDKLDPVTAAIKRFNDDAQTADAGKYKELVKTFQELADKGVVLDELTIGNVTTAWADKVGAASKVQVQAAEDAAEAAKELAAAQATGDVTAQAFARAALDTKKAIRDGLIQPADEATYYEAKLSEALAGVAGQAGAAATAYDQAANVQVLAARRLAEAQAQGAAAVAEAEIINKAADQAARERVSLDSARGQAILAEVRDIEAWNRVARESAAIRAANDNLSDLRAEIALMGQSEAVRARAIQSIGIQRQAVERFGDATSAAAREWIGLQEEIADGQAIQAFEDDVNQVSEEIAGDLATAMFEGMAGSETNILDWFKGLLKRMAIEIIKQQFVLPITTQVVSAAPSLFGIQGPVTGAQAAQAVAGGGGVGTTDLLSLGKSLVPNSWTSGITSAIDMWGAQTLGIGSVAYGGAPVVASNGMLVGGGATSLAAPTGVVGGLSAYAASAGAGALGGMVGGYIGTATNSKAVGALSGAALGAGSAGLASLLGLSAAGGPVGLAIGAIVGGLTGALGTQKKPTAGAASSGIITADGEVVNRATSSRAGADPDGVTAIADGVLGVLSALKAAGATLAETGISAGYDDKRGYFAYRDGFNGRMVSESTDPAEVVRAFLSDLQSTGDLSFDDPVLQKALEAPFKDLEDFAANLDLAQTISAGKTALADYDTSLAAVAEAARAAAADGFAPLYEQLSRATDMGLGEDYKAVLGGQLQTMLDQMVAPVQYTALETAMATLDGQMAALANTSRDLGLGLDATITAATASAKAALADQGGRELERATREVSGRGYLNALNDQVTAFAANLRQADTLGLTAASSLGLFTANVEAALDGLTGSQLDDVIREFGAVGTEAGDAIAAAAAQIRAANATLAAEELGARVMSTTAKGQAILDIREIIQQGKADSLIDRDGALAVARAALAGVADGLDPATLTALMGEFSAMPVVLEALSEALANTTAPTAVLADIEARLGQARDAAQADYLSALTAQGQALRNAASALRSFAVSMGDLIDRLALDADLSTLDPGGRLDEAWRQLSEALSGAVAGVSEDLITRVRAGDGAAQSQLTALLDAGTVDASAATGIESLIEATLRAGRSYYADLSAYGQEYGVLTGLADDLATSADKAADAYDDSADAADKTIIALGGTATAANDLTAGLSGTSASLAALATAAQDAAATWRGYSTRDYGDASVSGTNQLYAAATVAAGTPYTGGFSGSAFRDWSVGRYGDLGAGSWDATGDTSALLRAVTGYGGAFSDDAFTRYAMDLDEVRKQAARSILTSAGLVPKFADGGQHMGGLRLVGELGPELEVTGPSRIHSASQTRDILSGLSAPDMSPVVRAIETGSTNVVRMIETSGAHVAGAVDRMGAQIERMSNELADHKREIGRLTAILDKRLRVA